MSFLCRRARCSASARADRSSIARASVDRMRNGQGGYQLRTHGGARADSVADRHRRLGHVHPPAARRVRLHRRRGTLHAGGATRCRSTSSSSRRPIRRRSSREYARITGIAELPRAVDVRLHAVASHARRARTRSLWVARTFREKKLPCDALIYLGTEFTPSGWNTRNGEFTWKPENFPDPKRCIDELHAQHFKVVLHIVIEGRRMTRRGGRSVHARQGRAERPHAGRSVARRSRRRRATGRTTSRCIDLGVDGWWPDQGDGLDAPSRLARIRMYWEGPQQWRPNERPFALHRNGYAGHAALRRVPLVGRRATRRGRRSKTHVPVAINTGLSGIPFWGTDIGGFVPTAEYTGELHVRWFQFGAFCPLVPRARPQLAPAAAVGLEHAASSARRSCAATPAARPIPIRASCTTRASSRSSRSTSSCATGCCRTSTRSRASAARPGCR